MPPNYTLEADLVIHAKWVISVDADSQILENHSVVVADKRIIKILSQDEARKKVLAAQTVELPHHALIPGLINASRANNPALPNLDVAFNPKLAGAAAAKIAVVISLFPAWLLLQSTL